ncbi:MAG: Hpt domain-containing protein [Alphaproteobacteria bacterium]|nr:Hpt domain-containing protein [Alphaproteobacteria bacterium]MBL6938589.1 Hpt domain-containing protein [Alphaproteobacteria bacterium]MBL7098054.1 Hpt domain-containing protein [Alphaproteobacteria bacterium]
MSKKPQANFISAANYKPLVPRERRQAVAAMLKSTKTLARAARVIAMKTAELRGAVLGLVDEMERAAQAGDLPATFEAAHEIRGLAGTAGLTATGRIANGLCRYLDAVAMLRTDADRAVIHLHIDAILRSSRTEDEALRHGDAVAEQLVTLVSRKLSGIKE